jgi:hypothetical protein
MASSDIGGTSFDENPPARRADGPLLDRFRSNPSAFEDRRGDALGGCARSTLRIGRLSVAIRWIGGGRRVGSFCR